MYQHNSQKQNRSTVIYSRKNISKNLLGNVNKKIHQDDYSHQLKQQNQFNSQSIIKALCLQILQLQTGQKLSSIKIKVKNLSKLQLHYVLLDMVDIIYTDFRQKVTIFLVNSDVSTFLQNKQIQFRIEGTSLELLQVLNHLFEMSKKFIYEKEEKRAGEEIQYKGKVSVQQLQKALYKSLSKLDIRNDFQQTMIKKLRGIYCKLIQSNLNLKSSLLQSINNLLLQIVDQVEVYGSKCKAMVIKIIRLFQFYLFDKSQTIISMLYGNIKPTIDYIVKKLKINSIQHAFTQFKKLIKKNQIEINGQQEKEFLRLFNMTSSLFVQLQPYSFEQYLEAAMGKQSRFIKQQDPRLVNFIENLRKSQFDSQIYKHKQKIEKQLHYDVNYNYDKPMTSSFFSQIENQKQLPNNSCLKCSPFFFLDHRLSQSSSAIPVKTFQNVQKFSQIQKEFVEIAVDYLNHGGGFVAFGISKKQMKEKVVGDRISKEKKQLIVQQIKTSFKKNIDSLNNSPGQIEVDFAPVSENPTKQRANCYTNKGNERERKFLENTYVTRVKICASNSADVYFLKDMQKPKFFASVNTNIVELNNKQITRLIKWKMKTFLRNQYNSVMMTVPQNFFDHQCKHFEYSPERFKNSTPIQLTIQNQKQFQYKEMCLLIARQKDLPLIKRKMLDRGWRCSIQIKFIDKKFASMKHTSVLYIDLEFPRILKEICFSGDFLIRQKSLLAIQIRRHVKVENKNEENEFSLQQYLTVQSWIKSDYKNEKIQLYEFRVGSKKQYYFEAKSKTSCLYIYYLLNHLSFRSSLKQPKGLNQLSKEQRQNIWIRLFPE